MHVQSLNPYASLLETYKAHTTQQASNNEAPTKDGSTVPVNDDALSSTKAVTGSGTSRLSPETVGYGIQASQHVNTSKTKVPLHAGTRHDLENIARDPVYAAKRAEELGTFANAVFSPAKEFPFPSAEFPNKAPSEADINAFRKKMDVRMARAEVVHQKRTAYYENLKAQNVPPKVQR